MAPMSWDPFVEAERRNVRVERVNLTGSGVRGLCIQGAGVILRRRDLRSERNVYQSRAVRSPTNQLGTSLVSASMATQVHTSP